MGVKKWNQLKKFMEVEVDEICICAKFVGHGLSIFRVLSTGGWGGEGSTPNSASSPKKIFKYKITQSAQRC